MNEPDRRPLRELAPPLIPARTSFDPLVPAAKGRPSRVGTRSRLVRTGIIPFLERLLNEAGETALAAQVSGFTIV